MATWYTRKQGYGACGQPQQQAQQKQQQQQPETSMMNAGKDEPKDWEERGTVLSLLLEVANVAFSRVFLLLTLVGSLQAASDSFMRCSREETPALKHYGEELICHYTKAFIFTFPAMATTVLVLLCGRDLLQKRLYYGILKNGGVITFSENTPYKDPMIMAMLVDFLHCVAYTIFHLMILHREGHMHDLQQEGFIPETHTTEAPKASGLEDAAAFLLAAFRAGGPKLGGAKTGGRTRVNPFGQDNELGEYMQTVMFLVATFMETVLLLIFIWYAYDITASLVPMSKYLDGYEDLEEEEHRFAIPRLHTFKDMVAKRILEDSLHIIPTVDGDLDKLYKRVVTKYTAHKHEIRGKGHDIMQTAPSVKDQSPRRFVWTTLQHLSSIGLSRSLWPADLLLRREVQGHDTKTFRRAWVVYASLAMLALASVFFIIGGEMLRELVLLGSRDWEQLVPLSIMFVHILIVCVAIWSFVESVAPLAFSRQLTTQSSPR